MPSRWSLPLIVRVFCGIVFLLGTAPAADAAEIRPNVLWITAEDHGPQLGCYGDPVARTPNLDKLAERGMRYERCWSVCPVCAPARTALITGRYPSSLGAEHMRSLVPLPRNTSLYPKLLRDAGYYCTNNSKEDYNVIAPGPVWDESSNKAHWSKRPDGKPFFAVFNFTGCHESRMHRLAGKAPNTDPASIRVPAYHPDLPDVRRDWAHYYDGLRESDTEASRLLTELNAAGLAGDTIVFYYADHGFGLARGKRSACDSGLRVPLIVYFPEKFRHLAPPEYKVGGVSDRLVSFVDFAPTLLAICGVAPPPWMDGKPFAGSNPAAPHKMVFGSRGRMDERHDLVRCVTDGRYVYVRNYIVDIPHGQHVDYQFKGPLTQAWHAAFVAGKTNVAQSQFWLSPRAPEELYDLSTDRDEVQNLASRPELTPQLKSFRTALADWTRRHGDLSLWPESEMLARSSGDSPRDRLYNADDPREREQVERSTWAASLPEAKSESRGEGSKVPFDSPFAAVVYWELMQRRFAGQGLAPALHGRVSELLKHPSPAVAILAAELLLREATGSNAAASRLCEIVGENRDNAAVLAEALAAMERNAGALRQSSARMVCATIPDSNRKWNQRVAPKVVLLRDRVLAGLEGTEGAKK